MIYFTFLFSFSFLLSSPLFFTPFLSFLPSLTTISRFRENKDGQNTESFCSYPSEEDKQVEHLTHK